MSQDDKKPLDQRIAEADLVVNSFNKMIKCGQVKKTDKGLQIRLKDMHDKKRADGTPWNRRNMTKPSTVVHVQEIATHLMNNGRVPQIEVQARPGGGVWKVDGYCRSAAYAIADAGGVGELWVDIVPFVGTELDALVRIDTSNNDQKLTPIERLDLYTSIRDTMRSMGFKGTLAEVAEQVGKTRQYVDQVFQLAELDEEGKELVETGAVSTSLAIDAVRKSKKPESEGQTATEVIKAAVAKAESNGKGKASTSTVSEPTVSPGLLLDMYAIIAPLRSSLTPDEALDIENYLKGNKSVPRSSNFVKVPLEEWARLTALVAEGDRQVEEKREKIQARIDKAKQQDLEDEIDRSE